VSKKISVDPITGALLVMDFQIMTVNGYAADAEGLLASTAGLVEAARQAGMMVIHVVVGFRAGHPEINPQNLTFFTVVKKANLLVLGEADAAIHPAVAPESGEVVITKHRVSAFAGTELDMILRANGIETLILAGITTSGVVLSTVRHAADADYRIIVVEDCCSDKDEEAHRVLVERVFPTQATVVVTDEIIGALFTSFSGGSDKNYT
jgi:nicotinamidase-related amidase